MSCATEGFSARIAMVLDSLASIGNLSLQRPSVWIALHGDRKCCGTSVVTLDLPLCRAEDVNVSPGAICLSDAFGKSDADLIFEFAGGAKQACTCKLSLFSCAHCDSRHRRDNNINDHGTRTPPEVA